MPKLKASEQLNWPEMYVYNTQLYVDLIAYVTEFLGECEHAGVQATMRELSSDTVDDMKKWREKRKQLLLEDFATYITN